MIADALVGAELLAFAAAYVVAARRVRRWPVVRTAAFVAGLIAIAVALIALDGAAHRRLSGHMVQHVVLAFVAAPLVVAGSPLALALRATRARARARRTVRIATAAGHPVVGWLGLPAAMAVTHFSGIYEAALERPVVHAAEHALYLLAAMAFWRPVLGVDPVPHRPGPVGGLLYLVLAAGPLAVVGVALGSSSRPWYPAYAGGADALADQRAAGAIMWVGGGVALAVLVLGSTWVAIEREHRRRVAYEEAAT
jgi:putative copper resistance protein D